jgi:UDP:flavonoid glycosyltransferase YjiC (YdhE family)
MTAPRKFLIASWDGGGNTPSAYNLGTRLVRAGHRVRLIGWPSMAGAAESSGLEFGTYASMELWPVGLSQDEGWDRLAALLLGSATREDILAEAADFRPDVMVVDCMMLSAFEAASRLGCPTAVLVHVLYAPFVLEWGDAVLNTCLADVLAQTDRVLALTPPGFDRDCVLPANTSYVGPINRPHGSGGEAGGAMSDADLAWLTRPGDPWLLLSLSTTLQGQGKALPTLLEAVGSLPVRGLLTLGDVLPVESVSAPPNVMVRAYVPHERVLPHMSAVISHGGLSTITAALSHGLPMICVPQGREQPVNAARVQDLGLGRSLPTDCSADHLAASIGEVLGDNGFRARASDFARTIARLGGGSVATRLVEDLAG